MYKIGVDLGGTNIVAGVISGLALIIFAVPAIKRKLKRSDGTDIQ